jgi:hypothetical protein
MSLFEKTHEKGSREWKSVGSVLRERRGDLYPTAKQRIVHLRIQPSASFRQQFFILKNAH